MRYPSLMGWTVPARRAASTARPAPADGTSYGRVSALPKTSSRTPSSSGERSADQITRTPPGRSSRRASIEERRLVERGVGLVHEVARAVVDVEQHQVVGVVGRLGHRQADVGDDRVGPLVREQPRPVRDRAVAHPVDQRLLDLDDAAPLDPAVGEHAVHRVAEPQSADQHVPRVVVQLQRGVRQRLLGAGLLGVHHEDPVRPELQRRRRPGLPPLPQHQLAALRLRPRDLDVLHWLPRASSNVRHTNVVVIATTSYDAIAGSPQGDKEADSRRGCRGRKRT